MRGRDLVRLDNRAPSETRRNPKEKIPGTPVNGPLSESPGAGPLTMNPFSLFSPSEIRWTGGPLTESQPSFVRSPF